MSEGSFIGNRNPNIHIFEWNAETLFMALNEGLLSANDPT
jgi:hypothetical protein